MSQQDHDYIIQRHASQELLGSCQNLAKGANESARPRLHPTNMQIKSIQALDKILHKKRMSQQDHGNIIQNAIKSSQACSLA